ncbi:MAG: hypothetical protein K6G34_14440 [Lachnospiraceae bacterium]|nr:hypothetical protein [Lachnospiraceae bacterium]
MKENTSKNVRNAHLLLAAYWGYKVLTGKSIPKTTIEVLRIERSSVLKQKREAELAEQNNPQIEVPGKKRKTASAALYGIAKKPLFRKAGKKILRNARVI